MSFFRPKAVTIEFKQEWMGHPKGSRLTVWESVAKQLIDRGVGVEVKVVSSSSSEEEKSFRRPPKDKMVKVAEKSK